MKRQLALVAGGMSLAAIALKRRTPLTLLAGSVGAIVAARTANEWLSRADQENDKPRSERFEECARAQTVGAALAHVFGFVRDQSFLPQLLPPVKLVNPVDETRSIWTVAYSKASALLDVEATTGTDDDNIKFNITRNGTTFGECTILLIPTNHSLDQTRVTVRVKFYPPFPHAGTLLLKPLLTMEIDSYLYSLKQLIETGEVARAK